MIRIWCLATLTVAITVPAAAHDMWLEPSSFAPDPGGPVAIGLWIEGGEGRDPVARSEERVVRFAVVPADGPERPVPGVEGADPAGIVRIETSSGTAAIVYVGEDARLELPGKEFEAYLEEEGLENVIRARRETGQSGAPGRERFSRSLKTLVTAGGGIPDDHPTGIPLELELLDARPVPEGYRVDLLLTFRGEPVPGALVDAKALAGASSAPAPSRTCEAGLVSFVLGPGPWMAATTYMLPSSEPDADWRSFWSTLTFSLPEAGAGSP